MYIVEKKSGESFQYNKDETLLENLSKNNVLIKSSCGGFGKCVECKVKILSKITLPKLSLEEEQALGNVFFITKERLACQLKNLQIENELTIEVVNQP